LRRSHFFAHGHEVICPTRLSKYSIEVRRRRKSFDDDGGYAEKIPSSVRYEPLSRTVFCELDWVPNICSASTGGVREFLSSPKIFFFCFSEICVFILPSRLEQRGVRPIVTKDAVDATMPWAHEVAGRVQIRE
jgi:hypothetical protein